MIALDTPEKLRFRLVTGPGLNKPVVSLTIPALGAVNLCFWQCLYAFVNNIYLVSVVYFLLDNYGFILAFLIIAIPASYILLLQIRKKHTFTFWTKHHFPIPPITSLNKILT